jgi:hypothetical protein
VGRAGYLLDELLKEGFDHVRRLRRPEADAGPLDEDVRNRGEGERMAVGEIQDVAVLIRRNIPPGEVYYVPGGIRTRILVPTPGALWT